VTAPPRPRRVATTLRVRYAETDPMGVVYHSHYLVWCDVARTEFLRQLGHAYAELERGGLLLAVTEAWIRFLAPARYDDLVRVDAWLERVQSRAVRFAYEIARAEPAPTALLARAATTLVALDPEYRPRTLPSGLLRRLRDATSTPA